LEKRSAQSQSHIIVSRQLLSCCEGWSCCNEEEVVGREVNFIYPG
jgi:hypothetical protein